MSIVRAETFTGDSHIDDLELVPLDSSCHVARRRRPIQMLANHAQHCEHRDVGFTLYHIQ